tara:strand:+ start:16640 stop:17410 length:771 start_codon:yes stop_codon:yes gene_type:complete
VTEFVKVVEEQIAVKTLGALGDRPTVVMLHEGLGSITQWRDLPDKIHDATGLPVVVYDRSGYGRSSSRNSQYGPQFMHREASETLPVLLQELHVSKPILFGHSDGGTIALIAAASSEVEPLAVATIAAHIFVESAVIDGVQAAVARRNLIVEGMSRHHADPDSTFDRWADIWLNPKFTAFDIRGLLSKIKCPLLVLQGDRDEYATEEMVHGVTREVPHAVGTFIPECGHLAHRDQPTFLVEEFVKFLDENRFLIET